jgi:hypothetical protein
VDLPVSADAFMIDTRYGRLAATGHQDIVGRFLMRCGEWAWDETSFVASVLPENARVLDIGAFLGTSGPRLGVTRAARHCMLGGGRLSEAMPPSAFRLPLRRWHGPGRS